jgi:hypothetical protein
MDERALRAARSSTLSSQITRRDRIYYARSKENSLTVCIHRGDSITQNPMRWSREHNKLFIPVKSASTNLGVIFR